MPLGHAGLYCAELLQAELEAGPWRAVYPWRGGLSVRSGDGAEMRLKAGEGRALGRGAHALVRNDPAARYFLWEIHGPSAAPPATPGGLARMASHAMPLLPGEAAGGAAVLRFERVDLKPGVVTPRHTHRGSGLRVLVSGRLEAEIGEARLSLRPGDAWLEKGPGEPVIGRAAEGRRTAFVRLLVLPEDCLHRDSFVFLDAGDPARPKPAAYELFHEERVVL